MAQPRIEERTLYEPIIGYLKNIGFAALGETKLITKHPDILFKVNNTSVIASLMIMISLIGMSLETWLERQAYLYLTILSVLCVVFGVIGGLIAKIIGVEHDIHTKT